MLPGFWGFRVEACDSSGASLTHGFSRGSLESQRFGAEEGLGLRVFRFSGLRSSDVDLLPSRLAGFVSGFIEPSGFRSELLGFVAPVSAWGFQRGLGEEPSCEA